MSKTRKFVICDASEMFRQGWGASRPLSYNGIYTGALYAALQILFARLKHHKPDKYRIAFDAPPYLRKTQLFDGYKANRPKFEDDSYDFQYAKFCEFIASLNCGIIDPGYEADDIIAKLVEMNLETSEQILIFSRDADLLQLLRPNVLVHDFKAKKSMTESMFEETYGFPVSKWTLAKAINGDSDNIDGIPGLGLKTITKYFSGKASASVKQKIETNQELIQRNLKLITLPYDSKPIQDPIPTTISEIQFENFMDEFGFISFITKKDEILLNLNRNS